MMESPHDGGLLRVRYGGEQQVTPFELFFDNGLEVLVHIGLDTVGLNGKPSNHR